MYITTQTSLRDGPSAVRLRRKGVIVPLTAVLLVFLLGLGAFAVDVGWMAVTQSELQNAADVAALAAAGTLMDGYVDYNLPGNSANQASILTSAQAAARTKAKEYAGYNGAGGLSSLTLLDADVEFGTTNTSGAYSAYGPGSAYPNTIKVTLRRDSTANGTLNLFFGKVLGKSTTDLTATASATIYEAAINTIPGGTLPVTYNVNDWNNFVATGKDPDGTISKASNGYPELQVYPSVKAPGNFGWLSMDNQTVSASTLRSWIDDGVPQSDIDKLVADGLLPLSAHDTTKWDWQGKTGFTASGVMDVNTYVGKSFVLPLHKPYSSSEAGTGQGSNYFYNIVEFVGVRIMMPDKINREIVVQPAAIILPNALLEPSSIRPAGTGATNSATIFAAPRLTR